MIAKNALIIGNGKVRPQIFVILALINTDNSLVIVEIDRVARRNEKNLYTPMHTEDLDKEDPHSLITDRWL